LEAKVHKGVALKNKKGEKKSKIKKEKIKNKTKKKII
jgi:hypothetical protein